MDKQLLHLIYIYGITSSFMLIIVLFRTFYNKNVFKFKKYKLFNNFECDLLCFSHFIMYILLGYLSPNYWYISFILSIIWEYLEVYLSNMGVLIIPNLKNDIITNTLGLIIGIIINKYYRN